MSGRRIVIMCGITGCIDPEISRDKLKQNIERMNATQRHRGPDNSGLWVEEIIGLGHSRLKIIDLSDAANQPMQANECVIVFNGEIYNHVELREELQAHGFTFRTKTDTEIILAAYKRWGTFCTRHFAGMWAFAIWDKERKQLFCSRDRFGIKPFYYISRTGRFYFASEYRALKVSPVFSADLNINQLQRGLILGWTNYEDETYYDCIKSLKPGHNLIVSKEGTRIEQYWNLEWPYHNGHQISDPERRFHFYELFKQSLVQHVRSDVPVGACLSGGLDSSSIASLYSYLNPESRLDTFTIYYTGYGNIDERPFADEVSKKFQSVISPHTFTPDDDEVLSEFHRVADFSEVPLIGSSYLSQYLVMKQAAAQGIKVMLGGQGSDEYLGGYMHCFYRWMAYYFEKKEWSKAIQFMFYHRQKHQLTWRQLVSSIVKGFFMCFKNEEDALKMQLAQYSGLIKNPSTIKSLIHLPRISGSKINNFTYHMMFATSLPTLLHYEDRYSMAFSIESRVPFLDHRLVEYIYHLSPEYKISSEADTKFILRQSLRRILPSRIANRQDKRAFATPGETQWLRNGLHNLLQLDHDMFHWLNIPKVKQLIAAYERGDNREASLVWRLATFNYWLKHFA